MNKRMKKKWSRVERLETKVAQLMTENVLLTNALKQQNSRTTNLENIIERNAQAVNSEITTITIDTTKLAECVGRLESENKSMRVDLDKAIVDFNKPKKKSFFNRK